MTLDERLSERYRERRLAWDQYFCALVAQMVSQPEIAYDRVAFCARLADDMLVQRLKREDTP